MKHSRPESSSATDMTTPPSKRACTDHKRRQPSSHAGSSRSIGSSSNLSDPARQISENVDNPVDFLQALFSLDASTKTWMLQQQQKNEEYAFSKPSPEVLNNFDLEIVKAVREGSLPRVRQMLQEGRTFDACNRFGESLIHMACRRGDTELVAFLLDEAGVQVDVCDDFGRRPLHDALWTSKPSLELVALLLARIPPSMLLAQDVRGHTPFHYARKAHWSIWVAFLREHATSLLRRVNIAQALHVVKGHTTE